MLWLKLLHVTTVFVSFVLFVLRAYSIFSQGQFHRTRLFRLAPHINDSILLASALGLVIALKQYPFIEAWLTVKVLLLPVYIFLGMAFMKWAKTGWERVVLFTSAVLCFAYIVSVAVSRQPLGIFSRVLN